MHFLSKSLEKGNNMEIVNMSFQEKLIIKVKNQRVIIVAKPFSSHGDVSFGIDAPKSMSVNREEIHFQKKEKLKKA